MSARWSNSPQRPLWRAVVSPAFPCSGACILLLAVCSGCNKKAEAPEAPPPPVEEVAPKPPPRPVITQEKFDRLLYDTPYADAVAFMGMEPSRQESTYDEGVEGYTRPSVIAWYIWENPDGSFVRLGFTEKRLTDMVSEDLPGAP